VRNQRKKEDDDEEPSASLMIQQMLAQKTNPMLVSMMGPTAASMGPGMGLGNVFDQPASAPVDSGAADAGPLSKVLMLENAVEEEDLKDDQEYNDLMEDMKEEAEKHGTVLKVTIPRPVEGQQVQGVGKVFIVFDFDAGASRAQASLNGRKFGDSVVKCTFMDEAKFNALEY